ncbi:hypothetical protein ICE98_03063 [Lactococcus lactis]|nr:hypothetical protein [Lactococcus lactis]
MVTTNKKSAPKKEPQFQKIMNSANGYLAYDNWNKKSCIMSLRIQ